MFDYLVAPLTCPRCGYTHPGQHPFEIDCQMSVGSDAHGNSISIGDRYGLEEDPTDGGYLPLRESPGRGSFTVLETWACTRCRTNLLWVAVRWVDGVLTDASATTLTQTQLEAADYINDLCLPLIHAPPADVVALPVRLLRDALVAAESQRWHFLRATPGRSPSVS